MTDQFVLVVGGAGYIGSHMCKLLTNSGHKVLILDDFSLGYRAAAKYGTLIEGSMADEKLLGEVFSKYKVSTVMHFAARAAVAESVANPLLYYSNNVKDSLILFGAMEKFGVRNLVFSSSCTVFGEVKKNPVDENASFAPISPYGRTKNMIEEVLRDLHRAHGWKVAVLRYFNAAGADPDGELGEHHEPETHLIPLAVDAALGKRPELTVFGNDYPTPDGSCVRDYIHIVDLADAHLRAMKKLLDGSESLLQLNLGSEKGYSVLEVLSAIEKVLGKKVPHSIGDRRPGDPPALVADSRLAFEKLGWKHKSSLDDIVRTSVKWHQNPRY